MVRRTKRCLFDMETQRKYGFQPVYDKKSKVLILGSFPSVKSRQIDFYYGNKQNRFWKMICGFFGEEVPTTTQEKKAFLFTNFEIYAIIYEKGFIFQTIKSCIENIICLWYNGVNIFVE